MTGAVLIPQEPFAAAYSQEMGLKDGAPSTGFVGEHDALFPAATQLSHGASSEQTLIRSACGVLCCRPEAPKISALSRESRCGHRSSERVLLAD